jgi:hypothetical protein
MTKLSSSLPEGEANGLSVIARSLIDEPHRVHAAVVLLDCKRVSTDFDDGSVVATARIRRLEIILGQDHERAEQIVRRAFEQRTGQMTLPIDLEDELNAAFDGIDLRTGELHRHRGKSGDNA